MRYRTIGNTSLQVSTLCLAAGHATARLERTLARALESGVNFVDAGSARAEAATGRALRRLGADASRLVLTATLPGDAASVTQAVQDSLQRLQRDHIELYRVPALGGGQPVAAAVRELQALVAQGRLRVVGVSQHAAWQIMQALGITAWRRLAQFEFLRVEAADAWLPAEALGLRAAAPLATGLISDRYLRQSNADWLPEAEAIHAIARRRALAPTQAALAFLLQLEGLCSVLIDPRHLESALAAADAGGARRRAA